jgi:hypothetical protein
VDHLSEGQVTARDRRQSADLGGGRHAAPEATAVSDVETPRINEFDPAVEIVEIASLEYSRLSASRESLELFFAESSARIDALGGIWTAAELYYCST